MNKYQIQSSKEKQAIIKHLIALGTGKIEPKNTMYGICFELKHRGSRTNSEMYDLVADLSLNWSKHSDHLGYPVPDSFKYYAEDEWANNPYGDARRELCLHLAAELKKLRLSYKSEQENNSDANN